MMIRAEDAVVDNTLSTGLEDTSPLVWVAVVVMARLLIMCDFSSCVLLG